MKAPPDIILTPIITEASMAGMNLTQYTFKVAVDAGKLEIARAAEELFGVKVKKVNTMNCIGRSKRMGMTMGKKPDWKKAIITLKEDSKPIEFFESMR